MKRTPPAAFLAGIFALHCEVGGWRRKGDSPIFAALKPFRLATSLAPQKSGQSPVKGYENARQFCNKCGKIP
jgi:hypothetical protein